MQRVGDGSTRNVNVSHVPHQLLPVPVGGVTSVFCQRAVDKYAGRFGGGSVVGAAEVKSKKVKLFCVWTKVVFIYFFYHELFFLRPLFPHKL